MFIGRIRLKFVEKEEENEVAAVLENIIILLLRAFEKKGLSKHLSSSFISKSNQIYFYATMIFCCIRTNSPLN